MAGVVLKADAVVEGVLAVVLVGGATSGVLGSSDYPGPVNGIVIAAAGLALVAVAVVLWRLARVPQASLRLVAAANAATALLAVAWLLLVDGFSTRGAVVVTAIAAALACLAVLQLRAARGGP